MTYSKYIFTNDTLKLVIDEDIVGYYLIVYKDPYSEKSNEDYLLDSLEDAFEEAKEKFGITREQWKSI